VLRRLAAAAAAALVAAVGAGAVPTAATAAGTKCVALVVDFTQTGGSVSSACVSVPTNATGSDVLVDGHHRVSFDPRYGNDFVCSIDGVPAGGCHATDGAHYWVYYHRAAGSRSWQVSQEGAGTYKPPNAATEGWVYDNGDSHAPAPRDVPYSSICTATPNTAAPTKPPASATASAATASGPKATAWGGAAAPAPVRRTPPTAAPSPTLRTAPSAFGTSRPAQPVASVDPPRARRPHRIPWALVVGVLAVAGLGGAAAIRLRRTDRMTP
jgi:hypothetical protein